MFLQMLETTEDGSWRLVTIDADKPTGRAPEILHKFLRSTSFQISMMLIVLSNAFINASFVHRHDETDARRKRIYYFIEVNITDGQVQRKNPDYKGVRKIRHGKF